MLRGQRLLGSDSWFGLYLCHLSLQNQRENSGFGLIVTLGVFRISPCVSQCARWRPLICTTMRCNDVSHSFSTVEDEEVRAVFQYEDTEFNFSDFVIRYEYERMTGNGRSLTMNTQLQAQIAFVIFVFAF